MGGNIGTPILALEPPTASRFYVIELSSFQIDLTPSLNPTVGVLLNITPDHLDRHGTMDRYASIKERVITGGQQVCVGMDDDYCRAIGTRAKRRRFVYMFSTEADFDEGYHPSEGKIRFDMSPMYEDLVDLGSMKTLRGQHNHQNALAAAAAIGALGGVLAPASWSPFMKKEPDLLRRLFETGEECLRRMRMPAAKYKPELETVATRRRALQSAFDSFPGLAHRMEDIGHAGKVLFVNDSKATNADSTGKALACWDGAIHLILGGKSKEGGIASLAPLFPRIAKAYLIGALER